MRRLVSVVVAAGFVAGSLFAGGPAEAASARVSRYVVSASCKYEDGSGQRACHWIGRDARNGNGKGLSLVNLWDGAAFVYMRAPRAKVTKANPLVVTIKGDGLVTVVHGRTVLARNVALQGVAC